MTNNVQALSAAELMTTGGGDWDWGDFQGGFTSALALGCAFTLNPVLCVGTAIGAVIGKYL